MSPPHFLRADKLCPSGKERRSTASILASTRRSQSTKNSLPAETPILMGSSGHFVYRGPIVQRSKTVANIRLTKTSVEFFYKKIFALIADLPINSFLSIFKEE